MSTIIETAQYIVKSILPENADVSVTQRDDNGTLIISVSALPEFIGQLIGKEGKVIKSLRTLLNLAYPDVRYQLEIKE
ncbi:MAG: KH domain-containing protein [Candidatus Shapirobacteria bacterium]